jgi:hypothetical protein
MVALIGFAALTVDVGYIFVSHGEMQAAVDAASLAGATAAPQGKSMATVRARISGHMNNIAGDPLSYNEMDVEVGYFNAAGNTFSLPTGAEIAAPNAARVVGGRTGVALFFAPVLGSSTTDISRTATAIYGGGRCAGIWGLDGIDGDGSLVTDSYDSSAGAYAAGNIYLNGDLCSNQDIDLEGDVSIGGDAMYGFGYSLITSGNSYDIYGVTAEQNGNVPIPGIDMVAAAASNDNLTIGLTDKGNDPFGGTQWDFAVSGNDSLTIVGGTYYMTSALIDGQATVTVLGPTTLYISGPATFTGGGIINATQDPKNLIIYSTGPTMTVKGGAAFYGAIVAPETDIKFTGGGEIFGAVMGRFVELLGDTQIHVESGAVRDLFAVGPEAPVLVQ